MTLLLQPLLLLLLIQLQAPAMPVPSHEASSHSPPPAPSKWGPYSGPSDFGANMVIILTVLFCAVFLVLAISAVIRYLLCADSRRGRPSSADPEKPSLDKSASQPPEAAPTQIFTAGEQTPGTEAPECAICLLEFADGDRVRVLPTCSHGFHVACIERWLRTKSSCPTCRQAAAGPAV